MILRPPRSTRTDTLFPYTTLFRSLGLTTVEGGWLTAVYSMTNVCMSLLLIKFRQQFGIQRFTRIVLIAFLVLNFSQIFVHSYGFALVVRGAGGFVASGLSTLALFYIMQSMPARSEERRLGTECLCTCRSRWSRYL